MHTRQSHSDLIDERLSSPDGRAELAKLTARLIIEETLEAECLDAIDRGYYEHGAAPGQGLCNGLRMDGLKTAEGEIEYAAPQVSGRDDPSHSEISDEPTGCTETLKDLEVELLARELSMRDIEDAFKDESGRRLPPRTKVSEIGERLWAYDRAFANRDLSVYDIAYLFIDGIAEPIRASQKSEPLLAVWGFTSAGGMVPLQQLAGSKEYAKTVSAFFQDMRALGLGDPLLMVSDGAQVIIEAIETCYLHSERQRYLPHRMRNFAAEVPEDL